jgi:Cu/Ag efflux protein CusF
MNKRILGLALALSATLAVPAWSQDKPAVPASDEGVAVIGREPGGAMAASVRVRTATIRAIDPATRDVTLSRPSGPDVVIHASEAVKNFDQLKVGDRVTLKQGEALLIGLRKVAGGIRERTDWVEVHVAQPGDRPGIVVRHRIQAIANVTAIDRKTGKVTLRGVRETRKFDVNDPKLLASLKVGDQVEATLLQGEALVVQPASAL